MGFVLLGKEFNGVADISFQNNEVDKLIYNGQTIWEHFPHWAGITTEGKFLWYKRNIDFSNKDNVFSVGGTSGFGTQSKCLCRHKNLILVGGNSAVASSSSVGSPIISYFSDWETPVWNTIALSEFSIDFGNVELLCSNGEVCVAVLLSSDSTKMQICRSTDCITWKKTYEYSSENATNKPSFIRFCNGKFYVGWGSRVLVSSNGSSWSEKSVGSFSIDIFYHDGMYFLSDSYSIHAGYNLNNLSEVASNAYDSIHFGKFSYYNGVYFCGSKRYSTDGLTWQINDLETESNHGSYSEDGHEQVIFDGSKYYAIDQLYNNELRLYAVSDDGITWGERKYFGNEEPYRNPSLGAIIDSQLFY